VDKAEIASRKRQRRRYFSDMGQERVWSQRGFGGLLNVLESLGDFLGDCWLSGLVSLSVSDWRCVRGFEVPREVNPAVLGDFFHEMVENIPSHWLCVDACIAGVRESFTDGSKGGAGVGEIIDDKPF
jgi:hypothetical protein